MDSAFIFPILVFSIRAAAKPNTRLSKSAGVSSACPLLIFELLFNVPLLLRQQNKLLLRSLLILKAAFFTFVATDTPSFIFFISASESTLVAAIRPELSIQRMGFARIFLVLALFDSGRNEDRHVLIQTCQGFLWVHVADVADIAADDVARAAVVAVADTVASVTADNTAIAAAPAHTVDVAALTIHDNRGLFVFPRPTRLPFSPLDHLSRPPLSPPFGLRLAASVWTSPTSF